MQKGKHIKMEGVFERLSASSKESEDNRLSCTCNSVFRKCFAEFHYRLSKWFLINQNI